MGNPAVKIARYDDILDLPENVVGEIIDGQLYTHSSPAPKHALAASSIEGELFLLSAKIMVRVVGGY